MPTLSNADRQFLQCLSELSYCNPFEPRRIELEKAVLGTEYTSDSLVAWSRTKVTERDERTNVVRITARAEAMANAITSRSDVCGKLTDQEAFWYDDLVSYVLYYRHLAICEDAVAKSWPKFRDERRDLLRPLSETQREAVADGAHLFACLHQIRRAFQNIFNFLIGESAPATRLRAQVWQSIFTHDLKRYRRTLYCRMSDLSTLITGPSGAGKELVARAIGLSQFRAFDPSTKRFLGRHRYPVGMVSWL